MLQMGSWDWVLLAAAAYLAIITLVRLMRNRRDALFDELSWRADIERRRKSIEMKSEERRKTIEKLNQRAG